MPIMSTAHWIVFAFATAGLNALALGLAELRSWRDQHR